MMGTTSRYGRSADMIASNATACIDGAYIPYLPAGLVSPDEWSEE